MGHQQGAISIRKRNNLLSIAFREEKLLKHISRSMFISACFDSSYF